MINRFNSSKRKINGYSKRPKLRTVIPKPRAYPRYIIKNNKIKITNQKKNELSECFLNGFKTIAKNITKINELVLKFKIGSNLINAKNTSIDNNAPMIRNEKDLKDFRNFSFITLSIRVITNIIKSEANTKLRLRN